MYYTNRSFFLNCVAVQTAKQLKPPPQESLPSNPSNPLPFSYTLVVDKYSEAEKTALPSNPFVK